jgi:Leu/Phe-tRNA-protein transferase
VSPRIKSDKSKRNRFEIRLDDEMNNILEECSKKLKITRTDVINKGIKMVKSELDKEK